MYQYPQSIFAAIRAERDDFLYNDIEIVDGLYHNQYKVVKKIHKYLNSSYVDGNYETINGVTRKKVFWNIGKRRAMVASKQLDIDVKDFLLISENPATEWNVYLLEKELKAWLKKHKLGKVLNQIVQELPEYGSVVLRKVKDGAQVVDLRYLFNDQSADSLKDGRYTNIKHLMSPDDLREMAGKWDKTEEVIDKFCAHTSKSYEDGENVNERAGSPLAEVWESFALRPVSYLENGGFLVGGKDDDKFELTRFIVAGIDQQMKNDNGQITGEEGIVLFSEQLRDFDDTGLKEVHYRKTKGRWLGVGVLEDTFEDQRMVNKTKDQEDKAAELASLILFQSADDLIQRNLLADVDNGEILKSKTGINRLDNKMALAEFQTIAQAYEAHADQESFSADLLSGEMPPASATATAVVNQLQQAASVYDYKKENVGLFLQEFINDLVFPELKKKIMMPHVFRFSGDVQEMEKVRERAVNGYLRTKILETGNIPLKEDYDLKKQELMLSYRKNGDKVWIDVVKDFFSNLEYEVSLEITGESKNIQSQLANLQVVMGLFAKFPGLLQNPVLKRLLFKFMSNMGMSVSELENAELEMTEQSSMQQMNPMMQNAASAQMDMAQPQAQLPTNQLMQ